MRDSYGLNGGLSKHLTSTIPPRSALSSLLTSITFHPSSWEPSSIIANGRNISWVNKGGNH